MDAALIVSMSRNGRKAVKRRGVLRMSAIGSYPERLLLVIALRGARSILPPQGRVTVRAVIAKLDNSGMFP